VKLRSISVLLCRGEMDLAYDLHRVGWKGWRRRSV